MIEPPAQRAPAGALLGQMLGSYRLERVLGEGGMGAVYEGLHPVIGARVAVKVLHPEVASNPSVVERFFNEARAVNLIGHRNVVRILDLASERGYYFCVMELLEGEPLSKRLAGGKRMPFASAAPLLLQCTAALGAAHERKIIHRDVKPDNIFLCREPGGGATVKLVDFGIAKLSAAVDVRRTTAGVVMGTPAYMSPEQAEGSEGLDGRSDVYSLGVVMFQMATGRLPFTETAHVQVMMAHLTTLPPRPSQLVPQVPRAFEKVILRCLAKAPGERYQTMQEVARALEAALAECGPGKAERPQPTEPELPGTLPSLPPLQDGAPVVPPTGTGMPGEPLPGAEMFEAFDPPPAMALPGALGPRFEKVARSPPLLTPEGSAPPGLDLALPPDPPRRPAPTPAPAPAPQLPREAPPLELDYRDRGRKASEEPVSVIEALPVGPGEVFEPEVKVRRPVGILLVLGLVAVGGVLLLLFAEWPSSGPGQPAAAAPTSAAPAAAPPASATAAFSCPKPAKASKGPRVTLELRTSPEHAQFKAEWEGGCVAGYSPLDLEVPQGARVHLTMRAGDGPVHESELTADSSRPILESLSP
jgi:serine/threonine protein kinase